MLGKGQIFASSRAQTQDLLLTAFVFGAVLSIKVATANHATDGAGTLQKWARSSTSQLHCSRAKSLDQLMLVFKLYGGPTSGL